MKDLTKKKPYRNREYLDWVKRQTCCCGCERPADDPHHAIGLGLSGAGMTAPDQYVMPMARDCHTKLHNTPEMWPQQWEWVAKTLAKAIEEEVEALANLSL